MMPFQFDPEDSGTLYVAMNEPMNMKGRDMSRSPASVALSRF